MNAVSSIASLRPLYEPLAALAGGAVYRERIPVWPLLSDPWAIIDPLLSAAPGDSTTLESSINRCQLIFNLFFVFSIFFIIISLLFSDLAGRLSPLCLPLRLDRSEFNSRRITALYVRLTEQTHCSAGNATIDQSTNGFYFLLFLLFLLFFIISFQWWWVVRVPGRTRNWPWSPFSR